MVKSNQAPQTIAKPGLTRKKLMPMCMAGLEIKRNSPAETYLPGVCPNPPGSAPTTAGVRRAYAAYQKFNAYR
ncbi:hypothetical protein EVAR_13172_1 [Eumeta japonica]|uniref:Uncharacterized protein n=1 Tax=Eumeta variegata TaxID=151549 RepID=A0A4C1UAL0_EUMVA|nr:hypothetical protein EVAR_13172_1 [Eumeta japonica]